MNQIYSHQPNIYFHPLCFCIYDINSATCVPNLQPSQIVIQIWGGGHGNFPNQELCFQNIPTPHECRVILKLFYNKLQLQHNIATIQMMICLLPLTTIHIFFRNKEPWWSARRKGTLPLYATIWQALLIVYKGPFSVTTTSTMIKLSVRHQDNSY